MDSRNIYKVKYSKSVARYLEKQNSTFKERFEKVVSDLALDPFDNDGRFQGAKIYIKSDLENLDFYLKYIIIY